MEVYRSGVSAYPSRIIPPLLFPVGQQSCKTAVWGGGGGGLSSLLSSRRLGVCACMCANAGDAADVADDDQGDE